MAKNSERPSTILHELPSRIREARERISASDSPDTSSHTYWQYEPDAILPSEAIRIFSQPNYISVFGRAAVGRSTAADRRALRELYELMVQPITIRDEQLRAAWSDARYALDQAAKGQWRPLEVGAKTEAGL